MEFPFVIPWQERVPLGRHLPGASGPAAAQQAADVVDLSGIALHPMGPGPKHVGCANGGAPIAGWLEKSR